VLSTDNKSFIVNTATNSNIMATAPDYVTWTLTTAGTTAAATNQTSVLTALGLTEEAAAGQVTPGLAEANKAVVLGAAKEIATITSATITTLTSTTVNGTTVNATTVATSGSPTTSSGVGAKAGATVTVAEQGSETVHKSVFTLTATPITMTDDPGNGSYAALKIYDFPAGNIITLGAAINADATLTEAWWVDDKGGDVGLGTVATAVGTALTATTQNIIATTATTSAAQVSTLDSQSAGVGISGVAGGTDADLVLNFRVDDDALHFPDVVTNGAFTGNATGWTLGAGWAYGTNSVDATLADTAMTQTPASPTLVTGVSYSLVFDATATAGSVVASVGGTAGTPRSTSATFTETIVAGADGVLAFTGTGFSGTIDNVVCTPLTGSGTVTGTVTVVWTNAGDF
jgi:hypothetical protein